MQTYNNTLGDNIELAIENLQAGKLVSFPTETVYGLGADAENLRAVNKVFIAKNRPTDHPLIVHISELDKLDYWAEGISNDAKLLAKHFWPGPLTLILQKKKHVLSKITGGQDTIAIRIPRHPLALAILRSFNGLVGPSANKYGRVSPTKAKHVLEDLSSDVDYIVDGGSCAIGIESTIADCTSSEPQILRQGSISEIEIAQVLQRQTPQRTTRNTSASGIRVPGSTKSHYAPVKPLSVVKFADLQNEIDKVLQKGETCAVLSFKEAPNFVAKQKVNWQVTLENPSVFTKNLYNNLRELDKLSVDKLIIERPQSTHGWLATIDRLARAST